jgi:hypothetical protein
MARFCKRNYGLVFALVAFLLGLPFFHYHPDNTHTHQSELPPHHHEGSFHSHELNGFVELINQNSANPWQSEEHHPHSDTDSSTNYFEVSLQKTSVNPVKAFKVFKSGNVQKPFIISEPALSHFVSFGILAFESSGFSDPPRGRSPPFFFV